MSSGYPELKGFYDLRKTVGSGGFAKVKLAYHTLTGEKVAIKIMDKKALRDHLPHVRLEIQAMRELWHQHICKLYQIIETDERIYMIMEYCPEGELFDYLVSKEKLEEDEARICFRQIVSAVAYIHFNGYAHRDLKPENLLLDEAQNLKLIDFGLCAKPKGGMNTLLSTLCGSPYYAAPELIYGEKYLGSQVDIWSMGVLLYALLCGFLPFDDDTSPKMYAKIQSGMYAEPEWLSEESLDVLDRMLHTDPTRRITISQLLDHPWLNKNFNAPVEWTSQYKKTLDKDCLRELAAHYQTAQAEMETRVSRWKYDYLTATYFLLLDMKMKGRPVRLLHGRSVSRNTPYPMVHSMFREPDVYMEIPGSPSIHQSQANSSSILQSQANSSSIHQSQANFSSILQSPYYNSDTIITPFEFLELTPSGDKPSQDSAPRKEAHGRDRVQDRLDVRELASRKICNVEKEEGERREGARMDKETFAVPQSLAPKQVKTPAPETLAASKEDAVLEKGVGSTSQRHMPEMSPMVKKHLQQFASHGGTACSSEKATVASTLSLSRSYDSQLYNLASMSATPVIDSQKKSSHSVDAGLFKIHLSTPGRCGKIRKSKNAIIGGLGRMINILTPKKRASTCEGPRRVRALHNVFRTTESNPDHILGVLKSTVEKMGIPYKQSDYNLRCTVMDDTWERMRLTFDLEVCSMNKSTYMGVCRKRVKGDTWYYKQLCKDIVLLSKLC